jgi:transcription antitermination factor NusG
MPWYAVHTRSRHEDRVWQGLTQKAYTVFLPKIEVWSQRKDRRKKIHIPMFPGYLFLCADISSNETKLIS